MDADLEEIRAGSQRPAQEWLSSFTQRLLTSTIRRRKELLSPPGWDGRRQLLRGSVSASGWRLRRMESLHSRLQQHPGRNCALQRQKEGGREEGCSEEPAHLRSQTFPAFLQSWRKVCGRKTFNWRFCFLHTWRERMLGAECGESFVCLKRIKSVKKNKSKDSEYLFYLCSGPKGPLCFTLEKGSILTPTKYKGSKLIGFQMIKKGSI